MRIAAYAGASTVLAAGVIIRAFCERPNFYSASVYLGESNACRMILLNFLLFTVGSTVFALQRLLYGRLRPIEIEQLWDKAWYAITETALAMTTFRDEVGGWFFIMFMSLLAGKVWSWIGEGRVEILEQQPPANPRLFHARLLTSLVVSNFFDVLMLRHCLHTLAAQPRPGMMVMFAFEFAVLTITSISTLVRYALTVNEIFIVQQQTKAKIQERREEIRAAREQAEQRVASGEAEALPANLEREEDVDDVDIDVPGWQEKGRWVLFLDLTTDFLKLILYMGFFTVLFLFSGIPIHMFRDLFITMRSFVKRISDYLKYRNATRDMHERYPDATAADLERDGTCIVCREEMHVWQPPQGNAARTSAADERQRPKKLPCGHILHFACLRSWLERQQVCPTCRRSVLAPTTANRTTQPRPGAALQPGGNVPGDEQAVDQGQGRAANGFLRPQPRAGHQHRDNHAQARARTFNFPGFRLTFAAGNAQQVRNALEAMQGRGPRQDPDAGGRGRGNAQDASRSTESSSLSADAIQEQLQDIERSVLRQINDLSNVTGQLRAVQALQSELARLRMARVGALPPQFGLQTSTSATGPMQPAESLFSAPHHAQGLPQHLSFNAHAQTPSIESSSSDLPSGLTLPEGWSIIPLQRFGAPAEQQNATQTSAEASSTEASRQPDPSSSGNRGDGGAEVTTSSQHVAQHGSQDAGHVSEHVPAARSSSDGDSGPGIHDDAKATNQAASHETGVTGQSRAEGTLVGLPNWSSNSSGQANLGATNGTGDQGTAEPGADGKGKSRASATVEDAQEDDDEGQA